MAAGAYGPALTLMDQVRDDPMVRETVLAIAGARRSREDLSLFASWLGLGR
jgi:hypothetical protein